MHPSRSSVLHRGSLVAIAALLGACAVGPDFVRPASPAVDRYTRETLPARTVEADGRSQRFASDMAIEADWWRRFKSAQLNAIVQQSVANNPTLQAAEASLRQSQDNLRAGHGVFYPQVEAGLDGRRECTAPSQQGLSSSGTLFSLVTLSGTISYALDVFGGQRRTVEGLRAQTDYERYESKAAYLTLTANVVNTVIARAAYAAQIRTAEQLIELEIQQLHATEAQVHAGTISYASVLSVRSLIAANQASLAPLAQKASEAEHLLAMLEGVTPAETALPAIELSELALPADLPVSVPSDLVRARPDILAAEAQLHLASANIGVATAAMFPSISLSGSYGAAAASLAKLSAGESRFWSIGPSATIPVFEGGRLWFGRQAAVDAYQQSQAGYRAVVLGAFAQVADFLNAVEHDAEALQAQVDALHAAAETLQLLQVNFQAGLVAYLEVLTADVQFHLARIAYLQAVAQRHQDTVGLFVALGGGGWNAPTAPAKRQAP
jgi:NodT family efflux transporter outer membrane factor (OMF) lipoprotein